LRPGSGGFIFNTMQRKRFLSNIRSNYHSKYDLKFVIGIQMS